MALTAVLSVAYGMNSVTYADCCKRACSCSLIVAMIFGDGSDCDAGAKTNSCEIRI